MLIHLDEMPTFQPSANFRTADLGTALVFAGSSAVTKPLSV